MSEAGYLELPVIEWRSGHFSPTGNGFAGFEPCRKKALL